MSILLASADGKNLNKLNEMIELHGNDNTHYSKKNPPIAAFDFDNTCIKNDIGALTTFWMINHNLIYQPPNIDWGAVSPFLTVAAQKALKSACHTQGNAGCLMRTDQHTPESRHCADEIVSIYQHEKTLAGEPAFIFKETAYINPSYAFSSQLRAGHTPAGIRKIAQDVVRFTLNNTTETKQKVGSLDGFDASIFYYQQISDLMKTLRLKGFEIWIVSASSQAIVEVSARRLGVNRHRVIGTRNTLDDAGKLTYRFQGVGKFPENNTEIIPYRQGKNRWINRLVLKTINHDEQMKRTSEITNRFIFAAGDSDTDLSMLEDAKYKLVIDQHKKTELLQIAEHYNDTEKGNWMIVNDIY